MAMRSEGLISRTAEVDPESLDWETKNATAGIALNRTQNAARSRFIEQVLSGSYRLERPLECVSCGGRQFKILCDRDRFGIPMGAEICVDCGLVWTSPRLAEVSLPQYYAEIYHPLTIGKAASEKRIHLLGRRQGKLIYRFCRDALSEAAKRELVIVEIGCAAGGNLAVFRDEAARDGISVSCCGCDFEGGYADIAENRFDVRFITGDIGNILEREIRADLVIMSHVLEHVIDIGAMRKSLCQLLKPDGFVYVEVPGVLDLRHKYEYLCDYARYRTHAHIYDFCLPTLERAMWPEFVLKKGDEYCHAVFSKSGNESRGSDRDWEGQYETVTESLRVAELRRHIMPRYVAARRNIFRARRKLLG